MRLLTNDFGVGGVPGDAVDRFMDVVARPASLVVISAGVLTFIWTWNMIDHLFNEPLLFSRMSTMLLAVLTVILASTELYLFHGGFRRWVDRNIFKIDVRQRNNRD